MADHELGAEVRDLEIDTAEELPYYYATDDTQEEYKNSHNLERYVDRKTKPTLGSLVDTCTRKRISEHVVFEQGMWVEYRSNDMKWKVGVVNRVLKQPPDDWDFDEEEGDPPDEKLEISYNIGIEGVVSEDNIRAPREGLEAIFGKRPWLWQQFTLLQLEKRLRFDEYHEYDFEQIDNLKFATTRYEAWLNTPQNSDFKELHDKQDDITKKLLRSHLMVPFDLMDFIVERKDEWDFNDHDISIYTYLGVLGSGGIIAFTTFMIQIVTPLLLLYNNILQTDGDPSGRFFVGNNATDKETFGLPLNGKFLPDTTFEEFCQSGGEPGRIEGKILIAMVLLIYMSSVVPDTFLSFYRTSGGARSTYSKINSLRNIIWEQNDDDTSQEIGYKLDRLMNTGYLSALYTIMLFILLNTPLILDIILNALAIEFIHQIDERLADADWWDEDNRWIKAGTIELVIQGTLRLRVLENITRVCNEYGINKKDYVEAVGGMKSLCNARQALLDEKDEKYMTRKERTFRDVADEAEAEGDAFVVNEYRKQLASFGLIEMILAKLGLRKKGVFERYPDYRVWSRWEKVLFLPALPSETVGQVKDSTKKTTVELGRDDYTEFVIHIFRNLTGRELADSVRKSIKHRYFMQIPLKIGLGIAEWILYVMVLLFPFIVLACILFIPLCY